MTSKYAVLILIALGLLTHFIFFGHPNQTVFDEVHFGKFVSGYYTGQYYFDIHPPLGKLLIAGFAKFFDFQPDLPAQAGFSFQNIGDKFPDSKYMALRFLPSLAGALIPLIIFLFAIEIGLSRRAGFVAGLLVALENGLLTQTRFILMDGFLILFGFLSLFFYFRSRNLPSISRYKILAGIFAGLALSIKWTGLGFLAIILIAEAWNILKNKKFREVVSSGLKLVLIPLVIYFAIFALHFSLLNKPGPGDAYMKAGFSERNLIKKFTELNLEMYSSNQRLTADHPYSSAWYTWPFMARSIFYWVDGNSKIYFIGNPVIWWASTIAIFITLISWLGEKLKIKSLNLFGKDRITAFLLGAYVINILPFIGVQRVMFLYHYLIALIFAIIALAYLVEKMYDEKNSKIIFVSLLIVSVASFIYFAPLSYGRQLYPEQFNNRMWLPGWK